MMINYIIKYTTIMGKKLPRNITAIYITIYINNYIYRLTLVRGSCELKTPALIISFSHYFKKLYG